MVGLTFNGNLLYTVTKTSHISSLFVLQESPSVKLNVSCRIKFSEYVYIFFNLMFYLIH